MSQFYWLIRQILKLGKRCFVKALWGDGCLGSLVQSYQILIGFEKSEIWTGRYCGRCGTVCRRDLNQTAESTRPPERLATANRADINYCSEPPTVCCCGAVQ